MGLFFLLISSRSVRDMVDINGLYNRCIVFISSKVLGAMGTPSTYEGSLIQLPTISLDVRFGCNGLEAVMIYSVAVLAFPTGWRNKVLGITVGFFIIQVLNILRIVSLAYSGTYYMGIFEVVHVYVAQGIMIAVSLGLFLLYLNFVNGKEKREVVSQE
jgi:exosortase/archaeosortase family protein